MDRPPVLVLLAIALITALAVRQYLQKRRQEMLNDASPVRSVLVEVTVKREFPAPNRRSRQREVIAAEEMRYEVYFRPLQGGSELKLRLTAPEYHRIDKGAHGTLSVQGMRFISFKSLSQ